MAESKSWYTSGELAKRWGVNTTKIGDFIRSGKLRAINLARDSDGIRTRYRISIAAIEEFERTREVSSLPLNREGI